MSKLLVISGCSAAGKTTLVERLLAENSAAARPVTHTTRNPRDGEVDGIHYHFVSRDQFLSLISSNEMVEFAEVHGNLYGTSKRAIQEIPEDMIPVAILDVEGAGSMREAFPGCNTVFIDVPEDELRRRLDGRGDAQADIDRRMNTARSERERRFEFDCIIENRDLEFSSKALTIVFQRVLDDRLRGKMTFSISKG